MWWWTFSQLITTCCWYTTSVNVKVNSAVYNTERLHNRPISGVSAKNKLGEITPGPNSADKVSWSYLRFSKNDSVTTISESRVSTGSLPVIGSQASHLSQRLSKHFGKDGMGATSEDVVPAPVFYRSLQQDLIKAVQKDPTNHSIVQLLDSSILELEWWRTCLKEWNGKPVVLSPPINDNYIRCIKTRMGSAQFPAPDRGRWTPEEQLHHINYLELLASFLALKAFAKHIANCHIVSYSS